MDRLEDSDSTWLVATFVLSVSVYFQDWWGLHLSFIYIQPWYGLLFASLVDTFVFHMPVVAPHVDSCFSECLFISPSSVLINHCVLAVISVISLHLSFFRSRVCTLISLHLLFRLTLKATLFIIFWRLILPSRCSKVIFHLLFSVIQSLLLI